MVHGCDKMDLPFVKTDGSVTPDRKAEDLSVRQALSQEIDDPPTICDINPDSAILIHDNSAEMMKVINEEPSSS